jgi:hypothetical protein
MSICGNESGATVVTDDKDLIGRVVRGKTAINYATRRQDVNKFGKDLKLSLEYLLPFPEAVWYLA